MGILMFGWEFPPHITGGLGTACHYLTKALTEKGIEINFLLPQSDRTENPGPDTSYSLPVKPVKIGKIDLATSLSKLLHRVQIPSSLSPYPAISVSFETGKETKQEKAEKLKNELEHFTTATVEALEEIKYDLIHAHDWPTYTAAMHVQKESKKPLILHVHSTEMDRGGTNSDEFVFELEKESFKKADKIIAVSNYTKNVLINNYEINPGKIEVVYHGVPPGFDNHTTADNLPHFSEKIVTFCGRITYQKGPAYFVNVASKLADMSDKIRFVMAGDGDLREEMIELTAELGLSKRFHFPGFLTREEVRYLWQISDVLVMPSVSEPFGLTGVEAISANLPVIVSRQSGLPELFPNVLQVDYWETETMATLVHQLINDPEMILEQKREGRRQLPKLSWSTAASQVIDLYNAVNRSF